MTPFCAHRPAAHAFSTGFPKGRPLLRIGFVAALLLGQKLACRSQAAAEASPVRTSVSLNGTWLFQRDKAASNEWKEVAVPSSFQSHEGTNFHGIGWYRKAVGPLQVPEGKRLLLHFQAAATQAEVWWNDQRLGTHLGGWTPFRFDVTELVRKAPNSSSELRVRLDEKVGHNTQGFLPIIAPHFGGIWQDVSLLTVPETYVDDLRLMAIGDPASRELRLEVPLSGSASEALSNLLVRARLHGQETWMGLSPVIERSAGVVNARAHVPEARLWSPAEPNLYEVEISLPGNNGDRIVTRAAFRSISAFGPELRLNGRPLSVRGILNWGYSPPLVEPNAGEGAWRTELEFAKANGFNLMKYCLWIPPKRYLELADEMGVLTWMEYPTWHPTLTEKFLGPLRQEFREFFQYDRNHPSVVLRSLTCETGPSAELKVIQSLYDAAHEMIPGALVEDDSSWIGWNRVNDFYDDHPYGNNHTWVKTLAGFSEHVLANGIKPLVLGESIAADTWVDRPAAIKRLGDRRPWWGPGALDDMARWAEQMRSLAGPVGLTNLHADSLRYGMLMRKYQIEAFRREVPYGGYVITVLRDIPNASMGLLDYEGNSKWTSAQWQWHRETIPLLQTENDRRSFLSRDALRSQILLSHFGSEPVENGRLVITLQQLEVQDNEERDGAKSEATRVLQTLIQTNIDQKCGTLAKLADLDWELPEVTAARHLLVRVELESKNQRWANSWHIWVVPEIMPRLGDVQLHPSLSSESAAELFPGCGLFDGAQSNRIVVAARFDPSLAGFLESGGRVLLLPDGQRHSFALSSHWFLRGAPYIPQHPLSGQVPRNLLLELQHFDLASQVVPELPQLDSFDPILMLWDTHDLQRVKTHGLVFETGVGRGKMLVSALRHGGLQNPAGRWLLACLLERLRSEAIPRHSLPDAVWAYAKARLDAEQTNLVARLWRFKPDPLDEGLELGWHKPSYDDRAWKEIRIGAWWESQGYPALDGWAWYRLSVDIPQNWSGREVFLSFEGVDDCYELYVEGQLAGKGGDLASRKDALTEKKSHNITGWVKPGRPVLLAVRVHDWYGAGGIFRPVTLGTLAFHPDLDLFR